MIELQHVSAGYGAQDVVRDVSLCRPKRPADRADWPQWQRQNHPAARHDAHAALPQRQYSAG